MGHSLKRKEDPRFIRGKGTYVDDVQLPGMLYLDIVRSPHAHAKLVKIDSTKALAVPGVLAVITGQDLAKYNLHWMPTLMSDTQMVLPVEKVMYQAQEVAAVLATSRYAAADGAAVVEVESRGTEQSRGRGPPGSPGTPSPRPARPWPPAAAAGRGRDRRSDG
jgi:carbon-monoxide dehydrogenase large subunit